MSDMREKIQTHFISGEPGTTGREPFEDSTSSGPGEKYAPSGPNVTGTQHQQAARDHGVNVPVIGSTGPHSGSSATTGTGHAHGVDALTAGSGNHAAATSDAHQHGHQHENRNPLTTDYGVGHGTHSNIPSGVSGNQSHGGAAAAGALAAAGTGAGAGVGHNQSHGVTGSTNNPNTLSSDYGVGHSHEKQHDNRGIVEKAKDAVGMGGDKSHSSSSTTHNTSSSTHHNTPSTHHNSSTTGATALGAGTGAGVAGAGAHHEKSVFSGDKPTRHTNENENDPNGQRIHSSTTAGADLNNRDIVDKINDALPGTPAKRHEGSGLTGAEAGVRSNVDQREHGDRVGAVGQDSHKYEGGLHSAPRTTGASGTDRFDADGPSHASQRAENQVHQDTSQRAPGQSTGGVGGILGTSDKDFTGRERQGKGAYADTDGKFELNTSGPAGNTALTGREGNLDNNPVAAHSSHATSGAHSGTAAGTDRVGETGEKKGLIQKIKEIL